MSKQKQEELINRATGLLVIDVIGSNPNGDPDKESDPRIRDNDRRGEISPVSFKRKLRDLIENKNGPVWNTISTIMKLDPDRFMISESRETELKNVRNLTEIQFIEKFWDGRIFGNTELEKGRKIPVKTGVVQFGLGVSVAPISVERLTTTSPAVQEYKSRGMTPLGFELFNMEFIACPFLLIPPPPGATDALRSDIDFLLKVIPYAYTQTASYIRSHVDIIHAWYIEHNSPLGSCSDFDLIPR